MSIDYFGNMTIKFSKQMNNKMINVTQLNSTYIDIYLAPSNDWHKFETFNLSKLNFTWNITAYEGDEMHIKLNFTSPESISTKNVKDLIVFHIKNASYFF
jgi:mevalonate kinase